MRTPRSRVAAIRLLWMSPQNKALRIAVQYGALQVSRSEIHSHRRRTNSPPAPVQYQPVLRKPAAIPLMVR